MAHLIGDRLIPLASSFEFTLPSIIMEVKNGSIQSGQIIATSHDLTPNGGLVREIPLFQGNLGW